ncbi:MAG: UDP-glucose dehydrogenase family protein [Angustibacter sp.]
MRISVIGCGHLGAPHAAAMAELGHEVIGVELDPEKFRLLRQGRSYFFETGLDELLAKHTASGALRFTQDLAEAAEFADLHFIAVGTPLRSDGHGYNVEQVIGAVTDLLPHLQRPATIVGKSTVTVGTVARLQELILAKASCPGIELVWNPEFLREGHAVADSLYPDRILAGLSSPAARAAITEVYRPIVERGDIELIITDPATAEIAKSAANSFLAAKISFINAMAEVCEVTGADVNTVAHAIGIDHRIGHGALRPGIGYGGGCLPKDVGAFTHRVRELGATGAADLLDAVNNINIGRISAAQALIERALGAPVTGLNLAFLGASFKAGTSDVRDSPAMRLAQQLLKSGANITIFDPQSLDIARAVHPEFSYAQSAIDAMADANLVVLATEWPEFTKNAELPVAAADQVNRRIIVDIRNAIEPEPWVRAGWQVWQLGCPPLGATGDSLGSSPGAAGAAGPKGASY